MPKPSKEEVNKKLREYRAATGNAATKRYEKTQNGFLMRLYRNIKSRVVGVQKKKHYLYKGLAFIDKDDFYHWAACSPRFLELFSAWENSGYDRRLTPSVDRINPNEGYHPKNMQWVTHSENSRLTRRWGQREVVGGKVVDQISGTSSGAPLA